MTDDWPSHREELARKTLDSVSDLLHRADLGQITNREAWLALGVIYDTVSGLVHPEILDVLTKARAEVDGDPGVLRRVWVRAAREGDTMPRVWIMSRIPGACTILIRTGLTLDATWRTEEVRRYDDLLEVEEAERKMIASLRKLNYEELVG